MERGAGSGLAATQSRALFSPSSSSPSQKPSRHTLVSLADPWGGAQPDGLAATTSASSPLVKGLMPVDLRQRGSWFHGDRSACPQDAVQYRETHYLLHESFDSAFTAWKNGSGKGEWSLALRMPTMNHKGVTCLTGRMALDAVPNFALMSSDGAMVIWEMADELTASEHSHNSKKATNFFMEVILNALMKPLNQHAPRIWRI